MALTSGLMLAQANFRPVLEFTLNLPAKALRRLTLAKSRNIVAHLRTFALLLVTNIMSDELLLSLETKLDRLILLTNRLQQENTELKARENAWQQERVRLIEKNELARSRVEAMITHLKSLDTE